jgi:hypothetical protein
MSIHTVTVTAVPNMDEDLPDDQYIDTVQFTVECPENANCSVWWECEKPECKDYEPTDDETDDGEYTRHGVFHQNIDGMWMTDSGQCAAKQADSASDAMQEAAEEAGLGVHQIELDYEGDGYWSATRIIPAEERDRIEAKAKELYAALLNGHDWDAIGAYIRTYWRGRAQDELKRAAS